MKNFGRFLTIKNKANQTQCRLAPRFILGVAENPVWKKQSQLPGQAYWRKISYSNGLQKCIRFVAAQKQSQSNPIAELCPEIRSTAGRRPVEKLEILNNLKGHVEKTKPIFWIGKLAQVFIWKAIMRNYAFSDRLKTKPIQTCPERSRMEPIGVLWPKNRKNNGAPAHKPVWQAYWPIYGIILLKVKRKAKKC
jgi:hypothetical protein